MNLYSIKNTVSTYFPYIIVAFIALFPLLEKAMGLNSGSILYAIYFLLIIGFLSIAPMKKVFAFIIVFATLPLVFYRFINNKNFGLDDIASIGDSNLKESVDFILSSGNYIIILIPVLISIVLVRVLDFKKINGYITIFAILFSMTFLIIYGKYYYYNVYDNYPIKLYKDYFLYRDEIKKIVDGYGKINNDKIHVPGTSNIKIYLIIGEASRNDYYSICSDYKENATPNLEKRLADKGFLPFCDVKSVALNTRYSVASMLSSQTIKNFKVLQNYGNILHLFNKFGFETNVFENNSLPEQVDSIHKSLVLSSFIPAKSISFSQDTYDLDFFKEIMPELEKKGDSLNIIHMKGNHQKYKDTYPKNFMKNVDETDYYKSVRYTDLSLSYLLESIEFADDNIIVFYVSDHGEYVNDFSDGKYGHGVLTLRRYNNSKEILDYLTDIPFFIYMNKSFLKNHANVEKCFRKNKDRRASQDNVFSTLLGLIKSDEALDLYDASYDLCSEDFKENNRFVYNSDINYRISDADAFIDADKD